MKQLQIVEIVDLIHAFLRTSGLSVYRSTNNGADGVTVSVYRSTNNGADGVTVGWGSSEYNID